MLTGAPLSRATAASAVVVMRGRIRYEKINMVDHEQLHRDYLDHVSALAAATGRACAASGHDGVVIHSGVAHKKSVFGDQYFPLRVVPHFAHWCPLAWADCAIVCVAGRKPILLRGRRVVDGALFNPVPLAAALAQGTTDALVLMSRPLADGERPPQAWAVPFVLRSVGATSADHVARVWRRSQP